jgi:hypothetical protein
VHRGRQLLSSERVPLVLLTAVLLALLGYVGLHRPDVLGFTAEHGTGLGTPADCPVSGAPTVATIARPDLLGLREGLRRLELFEGGMRPYEYGLVDSGSAWSDGEPGREESLPRRDRDPGGYEVRWWRANGDDLVADAFVFSTAGEARDYFTRASSDRCRTAAAALPARIPPGGRNLQWRNPDGFAQEDLFLLRGRRVYRVAVVRAEAGSRTTVAARNADFSVVDSFACLLPGVECGPDSSRTLVAVRGRGRGGAERPS